MRCLHRVAAPPLTVQCRDRPVLNCKRWFPDLQDKQARQGRAAVLGSALLLLDRVDLSKANRGHTSCGPPRSLDSMRWPAATLAPPLSNPTPEVLKFPSTRYAT